ncbi:MAG TPA: hypothetical protein VH373_06010 [Jatrophihabitantaceae bacterium]|jgi:hypothetical protein
MPRHNRRRVEAPLARPTGGAERRDDWRGVEYVVRMVAGSDKQYRCPGCDQLIRPGMPHVVVWPADDADAADRRHWHTSCWAARDRRAPSR